MRCATARVKALLDESGELGCIDRLRLRRHLARCAACRDWVEALPGTLNSRAFADGPPPFPAVFQSAVRRAAAGDAGRSPWLVPVPMWGAAAVATAVVGLLLLRPPLPALPEPSAAVTDTPAPALAYPTGPEIDLDLWILERRILEYGSSHGTSSDFALRRARVEGAIRRMHTAIGARPPSTGITGPRESPTPSGGTS